MAFFQIIKSLLSAMLGVRSAKDAEADFKKIDWRWYVFFGAVMVFIFAGFIALVVKIVLH